MLYSTIETQTLPTTLAEFMGWDAPIDGYKYEWNDGEIEKSEKMKKKHLKLIYALASLFDGTKAKKQKGLLIPEQDVMLTGIQLRRPDLAYFSGVQIENSDKTDDEPIPAFVIEIISPTDDAVKVEAKIAEYFKAGVEVLWHIYPENQAVYVYTSRKTVKICTDDDICSANPTLPDFEISANQLFA
ncbi:MAG: Uma2 family endonuclease [Spirosomaceae bacterium]|jgi:Uma2 family endonuclease|nr:Uma2 family endonuclease [Spirosomataceae bacterium]